MIIEALLFESGIIFHSFLIILPLETLRQIRSFYSCFRNVISTMTLLFVSGSIKCRLLVLDKMILVSGLCVRTSHP